MMPIPVLRLGCNCERSVMGDGVKALTLAIGSLALVAVGPGSGSYTLHLVIETSHGQHTTSSNRLTISVENGTMEFVPRQ
jgi:hypothetical protein